MTEQNRHDSPVARAVRDGHFDAVRAAVDAGLSPDTTDRDRLPLLVVAAAHGRREIVELLLGRGWDPNVAGWNGVTPLMAAANGGHHEIEALLIRSGANINASDADGTTALMYAVDSGNLETVRILLDQGAEAEVRNRAGFTAAQRRHTTSQALSTGSLADDTLRERFWSFRAKEHDPILRLLHDASIRRAHR